ncbi:N-acetylmuramoyl-L-alanine amidase [Salinicoccus roseus]|uniref:SPOR domain-containing protein n=1 Tax=Salinicoccus roseus TaxID=45670 RepID=A0A265E6F7_9STAP|nr:N-acetylmuramoyl-L-alanine amidase [Salinicoccus roseus]OZT77100.1 hypothetical protein CFN03_08470 [Salinicoccus roseus]
MVRLIAVDIGHDPNSFPPSKGVVRNGKGYAEYDFNKKLGTRIIELLKVNGFDVITNATYASLPQRTRYYDSKRPDLGISVHANAGAASVGGRCAFYWHSSKQGRKFATHIIDNMKDKGYGIHGNGLHASNYGSWTNLHMTRECTTFPMVLVEHGFMTNALDFPLIFGNKQDEYIEDMAECDVRAVCQYFGVSYKSSSRPKKAPAKPSTGGNLYRVQVGAFSKAGNARSLEAEVKKKGFSTYLAYDTDDDLYRVQVGAYGKKSNAESQLKKLRAKGYKDAFVADNNGHVVSDGTADANETTAPKENQTPRLIGDWQKNQHGTQWIKAEGTFTVGGSRVMSRFGSPYMSAPEGGWANPGWSCDYFEMTRTRESATKGYISVGYKSGGKLKYIPIRTWNPTTGAVGKLWGTLK